MTGKSLLTREEIDAQTALELTDRQLMAVAVGTGGLVGAAVAVDANVNVPINVDVDHNTICVNVAAVNSAATC
jgi:hypothetical protein